MLKRLVKYNSEILIVQVIIVIILAFGLYSFFSTNDEKDLIGVWEFVSGNYTFSDTSLTISGNTNLKSIKIYGNNHYSLVSQNELEEYFSAHSGLYLLEGDKYIETFKIHKDPDMIGKSATFKYQINGNQLVISSDYLKEVWKKIE